MTRDEAKSVAAELGADPVPAYRIAHRLGMPVETVYQALVRLNDARLACPRILRDGRVLGWSQAPGLAA
jgi:predicted Rossmann fold nucleotide-binding protein DprA/Smf involved in DNA uptake